MSAINQYKFLFVLMLLSFTSSAQRIMEYLDRGLIATPSGSGKMFVSWRMLGTDPQNISFNLYRSVNGKTQKVNPQPVTRATHATDDYPDTVSKRMYILKTLLNGKEIETSKPFTVQSFSNPYLSIPLQIPDGYAANDGSVGDVDGDGEYEIILHVAGKGRDNSHVGFTDPALIQCYKLSGALLWTINLGKNIREGAHYTQFMVYDLDGDGKAEVAMKTADGTIDGEGNVVGDSTKDWRNERGFILSGPEYLTVFNGLTGGATDITFFNPPRSINSLTPSAQELKRIWGDANGNRVDRFLAAVAYLDGVHPSLIMSRGYYTKTVITAWDLKNRKLEKRWVFDSDTPGNEKFAGQGNHNLTVADVDGDGKDEIVFGSMCIDDNGKGLYSTGLGHGDAMHVSDLDPSVPGLEVFGIQEKFSDAGCSFRSAATGEIYWKNPSVKAGEDGEGPGRGLALDIDPRYPGFESWVAGAGITGMFDAKGNKIADRTPACNFGVYWDSDVLREILNGTTIDKWDYENSRANRIFNAADYQCRSNNGTKANPVLSADILGDWREEVIYRTVDNKELRIFSTSIPTDLKLYSLMHDPQYRLSIAWQNVAYNQPPHLGFYLDEGIKTVAPRPKIVLSGHGKGFNRTIANGNKK